MLAPLCGLHWVRHTCVGPGAYRARKQHPDAVQLGAPLTLSALAPLSEVKQRLLHATGHSPASLCPQAPHHPLPLFLPRQRKDSSVCPRKSSHPSLLQTLTLYTMSSFAKWITNWEAFQQRPAHPKHQTKGKEPSLSHGSSWPTMGSNLPLTPF